MNGMAEHEPESYVSERTQIRHLRAMRAGLERILAVYRVYVCPVCWSKNREENQKDGKNRYQNNQKEQCI